MSENEKTPEQLAAMAAERKARKEAKAAAKAAKAASKKAGAGKKKQGGGNEEGLDVTKTGDFGEWYSQVVTRGELIDYYNVRCVGGGGGGASRAGADAV